MRWKTLRQSRSYSISFSVTQLGEQLRQCARSKSLTKGKELHARITGQELDTTTFLGNLLVQMYGSCRDIESAIAAFNRIRERNVYSWNIIITAFAQNGQFSSAKSLFDRMPEMDSVSWNLIITVYSQRGAVDEARAVFDRTPDHDVVTWNAMIAAYAQNGLCLRALALFKLMQVEGVRNDRITFTSTIDACADHPAVAEGKLIHSEIATSGALLDRKVYNSLINMYSKSGYITEAKSVFDPMQDRDVVTWTALVMSYSQNGHLEESRAVFDRMPQRDTMAWNVLILDYARNGDLSRAVELYSAVPEENAVSSTTMIVAYAQHGDMERAREVFDRLAHPDIVAWNAMIAAYVQHDSFSEALTVFQSMVECGNNPNRISFISALHACARLAVLDVGMAIHEETVVRGMESDETLMSMVINTYARCGKLAKAREVFERTEDSAGMLLWNTMLAAYAQNGHSSDSLELFQEMIHVGGEPDEVTFIIILSACSHSGLFPDGVKWFLSMKGDFGLAPIKDHFGCMIDLMGRVGQLEKAEDLIVSMPYEPDIVTWTTLVGACGVHRDDKRGMRISKLALVSSPTSSSPYALLSNLYTGDNPVLQS